jgi:hypothetical protein
MNYDFSQHTHVAAWHKAVSAVAQVKAIQDKWAELIGGFKGKLDL